MKTNIVDDPSASGKPNLSFIQGFARAPIGLKTVIAIVALEALACAVAAVVLIIDIFLYTPTSYEGAIFLVLLTAGGAAWLSAIALNLARGRAWARSGALTWQLLMLALAFGSFQGGAIGYGLLFLVPAGVVLGLLFTKPVVGSTMLRGER